MQIPNGEILKTLNLGNEVSLLKYSIDGKYLLVGDVSSKIKILDTSNWDEIKTITINNSNNRILSLDMSRYNKYLMFTFGDNLEVINWQDDTIIRRYSSADNSAIVKALFAGNTDAIILATSNKIIQIYTNTDKFETTIVQSELTINNLENIDRLNYKFACSGKPFTYGNFYF